MLKSKLTDVSVLIHIFITGGDFVSYTQYNFKRDFFYEAENAIENSSITFITGPKKCGKTVCLRQLADAYENALYINMKYDLIQMKTE